MAETGDRAVLDETDVRGFKNEYIDLALRMGVENAHSFSDELALDFGCGAGVTTRWLAGMTGYAVGLDYSSEGLESAAARQTGAGESYVLYDGGAFPFRDASFGLVHCRGVFLCIAERSSAASTAAEMFRCLKPGGKVLLVEGISRTPGKFRYGRGDYLDLFLGAGFRLDRDYPLRKGRWPGIYMIRYGLVPNRFFPPIAKFELAVRRRSPIPLLDYAHCLFVFVK